MPNRIEVNEERCKDCGICIITCPKKVLGRSDRINSKGYHPTEMVKEGCTACALCARMCPDHCITVYKEVDDKK